MLKDEVVQSSVEGVYAEEKKAEETLRRSEEKFRNIFENATDCMIYLDKSGRILDVNKKAVEVFGGSREELLGKHFARVTAGVVSVTDVPKVVTAFLEGIAGKKPRLNVSVKNKKNQVIHLECSNSILKISDKFVGLLVIARDVTERKRTEEALRKSEEKYRSLVELAPDIIVTSDLKGVVTSFNAAGTRISGYSEDEVVGKHFLKIGHIQPKDWPQFLRMFSSVLRGKVPKPLEVIFYHKDGTPRLVEVRVSLLKQNGKTTGILAILRDITERKKAEESLRESEERYRELTESISDIFFAMDKNLRYTYWNKASEKLTGISAKDAIGKSLTEVFPDVKGTKVEQNYLETLRTKQPQIFVNEYRARGKDFVFEINAYPSRGGLSVFVKDITEHKRMEEKLRQYSEHLEELVQKRTEELLESEKKYSVLVEEASDGVLILQDEKIVFANKKAAEVIGYSRDELKELPLEKLVDEKHLPFAKKMYERNLHGDIPITFEVEWIAKNGERIPIEVSGARIYYKGRPAVLRVARDIRERKRMEEQRLKLEKLVTIGELATMVGHDLRNPLQSIENAIYYLQNECASKSSCPIPQKAKEMLQVIDDSVNYADKIIRDLQDFSVTKAPKLEKADINAIVKEILSQVQIPKNVELRTELNYLPEIKADKDQIKRVFLNLITNGIQAMENGGTLIVSTKKTEGWVEISFKDTGVGISKENMEKIFSPFFTTRAKGIGMGLPICKKFVETNGGNIDVESEAGKGTTFTVKLPMLPKNGGEKQ